MHEQVGKTEAYIFLCMSYISVYLCIWYVDVYRHVRYIFAYDMRCNTDMYGLQRYIYASVFFNLFMHHEK